MLCRRSFIKLGVLTTGAAIPLVGCNTSWITTAIEDLPVIQSILDSIIGISGIATGNPLIPAGTMVIINAGISGAKISLEMIAQLIKDYQTTPNDTTIQKIHLALVELKDNLGPLLTDIQVHNVALRASIYAGVSLAISVVSAVQLLLPSNSLNMKANRIAVQPISLVGSAQLKSMYNSVIVMNGFPQHQVI